MDDLYEPGPPPPATPPAQSLPTEHLPDQVTATTGLEPETVPASHPVQAPETSNPERQEVDSNSEPDSDRFGPSRPQTPTDAEFFGDESARPAEEQLRWASYLPSTPPPQLVTTAASPTPDFDAIAALDPDNGFDMTDHSDTQSVSSDASQSVASEPLPVLGEVNDTRIIAPGYHAPVNWENQQTLEDAMLGPNGHFRAYADPRGNPPRSAPFAHLVNPDAATAIDTFNTEHPADPDDPTAVTIAGIQYFPNNSDDAAISAISTFHGNPRAAAPLWGAVNEGGYTGDRVEAWTGSHWQDPDTGGLDVPSQYDAIHTHVTRLGPGGSALVRTHPDATVYAPDATNPMPYTGHRTTVVVFPLDSQTPVWWDPMTGHTSTSAPGYLTDQTSFVQYISIPAHTAALGPAAPSDRSDDSSTRSSTPTGNAPEGPAPVSRPVTVPHHPPLHSSNRHRCHPRHLNRTGKTCTRPARHPPTPTKASGTSPTYPRAPKSTPSPPPSHLGIPPSGNCPTRTRPRSARP